MTPGIVPPPPLTPSKNLVGADFGDTYMVNLPHGLVFNQGAVITPAFNQTSAYSVEATAGLLFPVYKRFGFTVTTLDDFLNDPARQQEELIPVHRGRYLDLEIGRWGPACHCMAAGATGPTAGLPGQGPQAVSTSQAHLGAAAYLRLPAAATLATSLSGSGPG